MMSGNNVGGGTIPQDFSPAGFLYLNPEIAAFSNVFNVEDAYDRYPTEFSNLPYILPESNAFSSPHAAHVYIAQFRDVIDVSGLNNVIRVADSNILGTAAPDPTNSGTYVANFYRRISLDESDTSSNVFKLLPVPTSLSSVCGNPNADNTMLNSSNMRAGDAVKILKNEGRSLIYGTVLEIVDSETFRIEPRSLYPDDELTPPFLDDDGVNDYILFGIHVMDPDRIAHINFTRRYNQGFTDERPLLIMEPFNVELYQILYPDSRFLTEDEAFISSRNNWTTTECRITKASDIMNANDNFRSSLVIDSNLVFTSNATLDWNGTVLRDVSDDNSTGSCNVPRDTIITEWAIKNYVEKPYNTTAMFNDVVVTGAIDLSGNLFMSDGDVSTSTLNVGDSNFVVTDSSARVRRSDLEVSSNIICDSTAYANMVFAGTRIGVGGNSDTSDAWPAELYERTRGGSQDRAAENMAVRKKLLVGEEGSWQWESRNAGLSSLSNNGGNLVLAHSTALKHPLLVFSSNQPSGGGGGMFFDGNIFTTGVVVSLSDASRKKDVRKINKALDKVGLLDGCTFLREHETDDCPRSMGVVAQDVQRVAPEAVGKSDHTDALGVCYGNLCGLLIEATKELNTRLETMNERVKLLEREVSLSSWRRWKND